VIPVAGYGTRFLPLTKVIPKQLLPIGDKPAIQYVVEEAVASGIEEIIFVCHPENTSVVDYFRPNEALIAHLESNGKTEIIQKLHHIESMARFQVAMQEEALGLGHAILCAEKFIGKEPFVVMLPDVIIIDSGPSIQQSLQHCNGQWGLLLVEVALNNIESFGIIRGSHIADNIYRLEGAIEKPTAKDAPSNLGVTGRYLFPPSVFEHIRNAKQGVLGEIQLTDAIDKLAKEDPGIGIICPGSVFDVGTPAGLRNAWKNIELFS